MKRDKGPANDGTSYIHRPHGRPVSDKARRLTLNGETLTLLQWERRTGISRRTISSRIFTHGWSVEKALNSPPAQRHVLTHAGLSLTPKEWATRTGISADAICYRLQAGWTVADALTKPLRQAYNTKEKACLSDLKMGIGRSNFIFGAPL